MIKSPCRLSTPLLRHAFHSYTTYTPRGLLAVAATATAGPKQPRFSSTTGHERSLEDITLRQIFDAHDFWLQFSQQHTSDLARPSRGLFQNRYLTEPSGFLKYAQVTRQKCQQIVERVLSAASIEAYAGIPRQLDLLSDSLCRVLDIADFVRCTHPDTGYQAAAIQAYAFLFDYMNVLNTTPGLNAQLRKAISIHEASGSWNEEEKMVAQILLRDFSNSAIDLPAEKRQNFVQLSNQMKTLGNEFLDSMTPTTSYLDFDIKQLKGMDPLALARMSKGGKRVRLPTVGGVPYAALGTVEDEAIRREIYIAGRQSSKDQIKLLERLMVTRAEIANLSGHESYAHMNLSDKLAKSPEAVNSFLTALSGDNAPRVMQELAIMKEMKVADGISTGIEQWDLVYYRNRLNVDQKPKSRKPDFMSAYFSLGTVMQGLSRLFDRLYGIRLVPRGTSPGETWNSDVRRLDVLHETDGHVAVLYCDLFERAGKNPNPTHFTLRCSRLISSSETNEGSNSPQDANDGMAVSSSTSSNQHYQLPILALICDFSHPPNSRIPALLGFQDVKTLFHEMGHAIHSILGRTSLQVVSGTRCPTDFAELPSVLMEFFASDPSVLALFARHWETGAPLPYEMVEDSLLTQRRGQGIQTETQILFSLLDQAYHSSLPLKMKGGFDSTKAFFDVYDKYSSVREPRATNAQGFFGHLVEYGGTYYSYLFDRAIAAKVWKEVFRDGKGDGGVEREAGERYKEEVLKWGGGRSGWACVSAVLGEERLKDGGKEAMEEVGKWGVHS
ncbi:Mitochondrial intermediate peptidase [Imshaugia aleurites]|uniref:Mitochondrial intermediate peptidase n=1 Tax=Imshaugia aleurites TaxID=172621 RepID=A0A8H3FNJ8_9LECA|nr:Mitochondrial intermediate peptidase [Imshaugia aleurites]